MSRSSYKGLYSDKDLILIKEPFFEEDFNQNLLDKSKIKIFDKSLKILPEHLKSKFNVYTGKKFIELKITKRMINFKFGEFIYTREKHEYKKSRKKKLNKK